MEELYNNQSKYNNVFNRINNKFSFFEKYFIIKKKCFTDNLIYYFFCVLFRFIHLLSMTDFFVINSNQTNNNIVLKPYFKLLTCHTILKNYNFSFKNYVIIILLILLFFTIRIIIILYFINNIDNYLYNNKLILIKKYQVIIEHMFFLFFTYLIEYLSFSYYIYFIPDIFIIKHDINKYFKIIIIIISTILIIIYNIENYINIICINKIYTFTVCGIDLHLKEIKNFKINKTIKYKCSNFTIFVFIFLQNFVLILNIENYLNNKKITFKIIILVIVVLAIIIIFLKRINEFNYMHYFNILINVLLLFCFYSILINAIFFFFNYKVTNITCELISICIKILISYIIYTLFIFNNNKYLSSKIIEIIFQDKNSKNKKQFFIDVLYYFHQIMIKIKEENKIEFYLLLIKLLNKHMIICNRAFCNCKLLTNILKKIWIIKKEKNMKY